MATEPPVVDIRPVTDFAALGPIWRDLEQRAAGSFFQSWAWTGCLAEVRFPDPWVLSARRGDKIVALGLFNRGTGGRFRVKRPLFLGESGNPAVDSVFIEHNGLLLDRAEEKGLVQHCWSALASDEALSKASWRISGVAEHVAASLPADRPLRILARRPALYLSLNAEADIPVIERLSANARQQLRRSLRDWEKIGPLSLTVAADQGEAAAFLDGLKGLHQRYWTGRGKPGAFAEPSFERFHRALIGRPVEGQSTDLIRVSAGDRILGYLYNLVHDGWVAAYQSGFDFGPDADKLRPGLICHLLAIEHYRRAGMRLYDFLGGEARYKRGFADAETELLWLESRPNSRLRSAIGLIPRQREAKRG